MNEQISQTHEDHRRIFDELRRQQMSKRKASLKPKAVILCGQPGSGRSSQISKIMQEKSDNGALLIIDRRNTRTRRHTESF